jgi:hypothetical protein
VAHAPGEPVAQFHDTLGGYPFSKDGVKPLYLGFSHHIACQHRVRKVWNPVLQKTSEIMDLWCLHLLERGLCEKETKADQRPIWGLLAVSEVYIPSAKPRGSWGFSAL